MKRSVPFPLLLLLSVALVSTGCPPKKTPEKSPKTGDTKSPSDTPAGKTTGKTGSSSDALHKPAPESETKMSVTSADYGTTPDGEKVTEFTLTNKNGLRVKLIDWGAHVTAVETPDRDGQLANITLGFDDLAGYMGPDNQHFGATVGRYANRIAKGKFTLDGQEYTLATNNGPNHLHGGDKGFDRYVWKTEKIETPASVGVKFTHASPDADEGYPGTLTATVTYSLNNDNELSMDYTATTDKPTVVNLTNHCYWNLHGAGEGTVLDQQLTLNADQYLEVDETLIPTGKKIDVAGGPFDFTKGKAIGADFAEVKGDNPNGGYDHCYVVAGQPGQLRLAATAVDPASGRTMEVRTDQPGIQFYTGNFLHDQTGAGGKKYPQQGAFCLETQKFPDSPNHPDFPSSELKPGETYTHRTVHKFGVAGQ